MPNPSEPTSNSIFALQLQMMAINFTLHAEDKGLGSLLGCPPVWLSHSGCLPGCLPGQTEVIINARHERLFRDLCVRKIRDRVANNVNGDGIQNDARRGRSISRGECNGLCNAAASTARPGLGWNWPELLANHKSQL